MHLIKSQGTSALRLYIPGIHDCLLISCILECVFSSVKCIHQGPWNFRTLPDFSGRILLLTPCPPISLSHHFLRAASAVLILNSHVSGRSYNHPEGVLPTCCCCPIIAIFRLVWIMWAPRPPSSYLVKRVEWEGQHQTK